VLTEPNGQLVIVELKKIEKWGARRRPPQRWKDSKYLTVASFDADVPAKELGEAARRFRVLDIGVALQCGQRIEVVHREVLRWVIFASAADPLESSCSSELGENELLSMMIVAPRRELLMQFCRKPSCKVEDGSWGGHVLRLSVLS
jgi:hypothetical protein